MLNSSLQLLDAVSRAEIELMFEGFDVNGDGSVTREDLMSTLGVASMQTLSKALWLVIQLWFDVDGDHSIEKEEFLATFVVGALLLPHPQPPPGLNGEGLIFHMAIHFNENVNRIVRAVKSTIQIDTTEPIAMQTSLP